MLFGARGTGKSMLIRQRFAGEKTLWVDLLTHEDEERFGRYPDELSKLLSQKDFEKVVIDEIQKAPKLLDIVHREIEKHKGVQFILTGSSARKLRRGSANLLAGRAFTYYLFPFTAYELGEDFDLGRSLKFGSLPRLLEFSNEDDSAEFLRTYVRTYLREEVQIEQLVRNLNPFRDFLQVAAQTNGQILNYAKIARDLGIDQKTVTNYYSILEDTLLGVFLPSFHRSVRKKQREAPKFYLFDPGVKRALDNTLRVDLVPGTYAYGAAFEHWVMLECFRWNEYYKMDFEFSYLSTRDGAEVDLIVDRPGQGQLLIEIKSSDKTNDEDSRHLRKFAETWQGEVECQVWSRDPIEKKSREVSFLPWEKGLQQLFNIP